MRKSKLDMVREWMGQAIERDQEELRIWRERHPREASSVAEEARVKVEGREPDYGPAQAWL